MCNKMYSDGNAALPARLTVRGCRSHIPKHPWGLQGRHGLIQSHKQFCLRCFAGLWLVKGRHCSVLYVSHNVPYMISPPCIRPNEPISYQAVVHPHSVCVMPRCVIRRRFTASHCSVRQLHLQSQYFRFFGIHSIAPQREADPCHGTFTSPFLSLCTLHCLGVATL